ncbi:MAG TPA: helix-turn-helix domain-containing protein [Anaerolineaceae bacterium]|nr:helix-turn-helix domain-containing protein [Anaerolineaceae bacterium]HQH85564.1 helix-turn-helix domain-containing protein [Anaerolineaceae bacterium]
MDFLTTRQAGEILGVTIERILALIHAGRLPAQKVGRDWLIKASDLANFSRRRQGNYKLSAEQIEQIRMLAAQGTGIEALADRFGVSARTIYRHIRKS